MKRKKILYLLGAAIVIGTALLLGCKSKTSATKPTAHITTVTAKLQTQVTRLYYKGSLSPLTSTSVLSPVEGNITKLFFKYGAFVKKDQTLVLIDSTKLADDYREAITKYLQAKDAFGTGKQTYEGTVALYKAGVISSNDYATGKSQYETNVLNYYQAKFSLEKILAQANVDPKSIESLSIVDTKQVNQILQRQFSNIMVHAPADGVALFPVASESSGNDKTGKLTVGSEVKQGQLILSIGDLSGFSVVLPVSEISINKIKPGLSAIVTGDAFPGITLKGVVTSVANQANPDNSGGGNGMSLFNIEVQMPSITAEQQQIIHVGMTATIEIDINNPPRVLLPIQAVFQKNNQNMVTIVDPKTQTQRDVPVITGDTTLTDVVIVKGVNPGDVVVVHD